MAAYCTVAAKSVKVPLEICCIIQLQALSACLSLFLFSRLKSLYPFIPKVLSFSVLLPFFFSLAEFFPPACFVFVVSLFLPPTRSCPFSSETLTHSLLCLSLFCLPHHSFSFAHCLLYCCKQGSAIRLIFGFLFTVWASNSVITSLPKFSLASPIMHFI